jgi:hypothetical protein
MFTRRRVTAADAARELRTLNVTLLAAAIFAATIQPCGYLLHAIDIIFFAVACFAAIALFMISRKPHA